MPNQSEKKSGLKEIIDSLLKLFTTKDSTAWEVRYWKMDSPDRYTEELPDAESARGFQSARNLEGFITVVNEVVTETDEDNPGIVSKIINGIFNLF